MLYTARRGYPYPASAKEAGNGGLHSELLARAIDTDMTALQAAWAAELVGDTLIQELRNADSSPMSSGGTPTPQFTDTITKQTGTGIKTNTSAVYPARPGWFQITAHSRARVTGATTAAARHQLILRHYRDDPGGGSLITVAERHALTFQGTTGDVFNTVSGIFQLRETDQVWMYYYHLNTASTVILVGTSTFGVRMQTVRLGDL